MDYKYFYQFCLYVFYMYSAHAQRKKTKKTTTYDDLTMVVPYPSGGEG